MPFLPLEPNETKLPVDFVMIIPEAYIDHPSFGHAIISRIIENEGFSIAINSQPLNENDYRKFGQPNIAFLISGGVVDSMVNNYTVNKRKRGKDVYSEGGITGKRPDRAITVYSNNLKKIYPDTPIIIGGTEASLRRFAHYDYWSDSVMPSLLADSKADLLIYGMGERALWEILALVKKGVPIKNIKDIRGTCYLSDFENLSNKMKEKFVSGGVDFCPSFEEVSSDKKKYVKSYKKQYIISNRINSKPLVQKHKNYYIIMNPIAYPLTTEEMDKVYAMDFMGDCHPSYKKGVPALNEVKFSITSHRGCFGGCSFCSIVFHQGRIISKRSKESIVNEAKKLSEEKDFKGYIHDIGGPTANFRNPACKNQEKVGSCTDKQCIGEKVCKNLIVDHKEYIDILRTVRNLPNIKKVFIRSGIRYDYLMYDENDEFFKELIKYHISGQLKVAPEHCVDNVLKIMNKPKFAIYESFVQKFNEENKSIGKEQYLVPYLISSHPGCTYEDAKKLNNYLKKIGHNPEQVQDFYPTPSTRSTCIFYTGIDPVSEENVYVPKSLDEKRKQRELLQIKRDKK